jgi:hypothetical protein
MLKPKDTPEWIISLKNIFKGREKIVLVEIHGYIVGWSIFFPFKEALIIIFHFVWDTSFICIYCLCKKKIEKSLLSF